MDLWFEYDGCSFLDVSGSRDVVDECLAHDVYGLRDISEGDGLLDLGGLYGECGIWASMRGIHVVGVEPTIESWAVSEANCRINGIPPIYSLAAVALESGDIPHHVRKHHPGGSGFASDGVVLPRVVEAIAIRSLLDRLRAENCKQIHVKMDVEGGELGLFSDLRWANGVSSVRMECHFENTQDYVSSLRCCGFSSVRSSGNVPGAIIIAKR